LESKITELQFCEHIEYICKYFHRHLLLQTGSFNEVLAYLDGYSHGAQVERHGHHSFTIPFCHRLAIKFSEERKPENAESNVLTWDEYREIFPDEEAAIDNLPVFYREFTESDHPKNLG
jgi:hypothetical protein